jgi:CelD/BcsL family acetyltransferase involved in cellulose biosynthesis
MDISVTAHTYDESAGARYAIETIADEDALDDVETDWNRLSEQVKPRNAFMTFGWFRTWARHYAENDKSGKFQSQVLLLRQGKELVGVAPLVRRISSRFGFYVRKLEFATTHADYNQLVLGNHPADQTDALVDFLAQTSEQWDIVDLRDIPDGEVGTALIERALVRNGLPFRVLPEEDGCPYLSIDGDAAHQMSKLSGHERRVLRRRSAQAAEQGLRVRIIEHPEQEPGLLEKMMLLESKKHLRSEFPPFIGLLPKVFRSLLDRLGPRGWLYVALLENGEEPVAHQLGFRCGDKLWDYHKAYDRDYARFAPGTILLPALLDYCFQHGYREYDFLRGEEPYKMVWSSGVHRRSRLLIWNRRGGSRVRKFVYHDLKTATRRLLRAQA